ncbi:MAG: hypothetical protein ACR2PI_07040 [Hyphomicrobiaceae bacterium]
MKLDVETDMPAAGRTAPDIKDDKGFPISQEEALWRVREARDLVESIGEISYDVSDELLQSQKAIYRLAALLSARLSRLG